MLPSSSDNSFVFFIVSFIKVTLTLEALKCGKRFHATVSFDTDTGMEGCTLFDIASL